MIKRKTLLLLIILCISGCSKKEVPTYEEQNEEIVTISEPTADVSPTKEPTPTKEQRKDQLLTVSFDSKALANNVVDETTDKEFYVLLPPSYYISDKSYPVVYYLHGQAEQPSTFMYGNMNNFKVAFEKGAAEFIVIGVNGTSNQGGAFYVNSPVSGFYEDYVVKEVVAYIDENFRTIPKRDSRGICGFSMGGFGAYNLAIRHPDVFCSVLSMSPGILADGDLPMAMTSWKTDKSFLMGYSRAFSPMLDDPDGQYGRIPQMDDTEEDRLVQKEWETGFGNVNEKLDAYLALDNPLKAIRFTYGVRDSYQWIPLGCEYMAKCLKEREIPYTMETYENGHYLPPKVVEDNIIPFFNENLVYEIK